LQQTKDKTNNLQSTNQRTVKAKNKRRKSTTASIKMTRYSLFARKLATALLFLFAAEQVAGSIHWDGPVDAAITRLATFLNDMGIEGAGVRPFGYGFTIGEAAPQEAPVAAEVGGEVGGQP
jgi:hypothetical protein